MRSLWLVCLDNTLRIALSQEDEQRHDRKDRWDLPWDSTWLCLDWANFSAYLPEAFGPDGAPVAVGSVLYC